MAVEPGSIVQVPLGPRQVLGVVWDGIDDGSVDPQKLKSITRVFDCPPLTKDMRTFLDWVATYTVSPPGLVARMALRAPAAFDPEPMIEGLRLTDARPERMTSARERVDCDGRKRLDLDAAGTGACGGNILQRDRRTDGARRVRDGVHAAAAGGGGPRS